MKYFFTLLGIVCATTTFAQGSWTMVSQSGTSDLNKISFATANLAVAVGSDGTLLRTLDGGQTWLRVAMSQDIDLHDVAFPAPGVIVAVGEKHWGAAVVAISYDSGSSWWLPNVAAFRPMNSVAFVNGATGFATSQGSILRTDDGGLTWTANAVGGNHFLNTIRFTDAMHGVVSGGTHDELGFTMRTSDGGRTWVADGDQYIEPIGGIFSVDARHAWRVGGDYEYGAFLSATQDGGGSWSQTVIPDVRLSLNDILFIDAAHGIAVGGVYELLTSDGGASWTKSQLFENGYLTSLTLSPRGELWGVGSAGRIMKRESPNRVTTGTNASSFTLAPNYPNPITSSTEFRFSLAEESSVVLAVYDVEGNLISDVVRQVLPAGDHATNWTAVDHSGNHLANGVYVLKLSIGESSLSRKIVVAR